MAKKKKKHIVKKDRTNVEHWHWSQSKDAPIKHKHKGGDDLHTHFNQGLIHYGRTKSELMEAPELQLDPSLDDWD